MSIVAKSMRARPRLVFVILVVAALAGLGVAERVVSSAVPAPPTVVGLAHSNISPPIYSNVISQMVRSAVDLAEGPGVGLSNVVHPGQSVLIQPNLVNAATTLYSGSGIVTDVRVVKEVVAMCFEAGASSVTIGEGTAAYLSGQDGTRDQTWKAFYYAGYSASAASRVFKYDPRVALVDFNDCGYTQDNWTQEKSGYSSTYVTEVEVPDSLLRTVLYMPNPLMTADVVIKVPILKNHNLAGITGALKTAVGTAPADIYHYPNMTIYKWALMHQPENLGGYLEPEANARTIVDLNKCRLPDFVVMDGLIGITNGPTGTSKPNPQIRCILAGRDPVAVDTVECLLEGYDPEHIPSLTHAAEEGLGTMDPARITVKCDEAQLTQHVNDARVDFPEGYGAGRRADNTDPEMDGLTAGNGAIVSGVIRVAPLNPSDDANNLCKVELFVDGAYAGNAAMAEGGVLWDTTSVADGPHSLKMYLYDDCLNETSASRTVTVYNGSLIGGLLGSQDNAPVQVQGLVTSFDASATDGWLYAQAPDRSGGIRILADPGSFALGSVLDVSGSMSTNADGERCIDSTKILAAAAVAVPEPLAMVNRSLGGADFSQWTAGIYGASGLYNVGLLVRTCGRVTYVDNAITPAYFYLDDGSALNDGSGHVGVKVLLRGLGAPSVDQSVAVTGISSVQQIGGHNQRVLIPRGAPDLQ